MYSRPMSSHIAQHLASLFSFHLVGRDEQLVSRLWVASPDINECLASRCNALGLLPEAVTVLAWIRYYITAVILVLSTSG